MMGLLADCESRVVCNGCIRENIYFSVARNEFLFNKKPLIHRRYFLKSNLSKWKLEEKWFKYE